MVMIKSCPVSRCSLGENPLWHPETSEYVFADNQNGILYAWNPDEDKCRILLESADRIGAFLFDEKGDLVLLMDQGVFTCVYPSLSHIAAKEQSSAAVTALYPLSLRPGEHFTSAICDCRGRILAGTTTQDQKDGILYLFETKKEPRMLMRGIGYNAGIGFSSDNKLFYHTDAMSRTIYRYFYHEEDGSIAANGQSSQDTLPETPFGTIVFTSENEQEVPMNLKIDKFNTIWTALKGSGEIRNFDPLTHEVFRTVPVPADLVSGIAFGGGNGHGFLITAEADTSLGETEGNIWYLTNLGKGLPLYRACI